jgi:hypothetical protein
MLAEIVRMYLVVVCEQGACVWMWVCVWVWVCWRGVVEEKLYCWDHANMCLKYVRTRSESAIAVGAAANTRQTMVPTWADLHAHGIHPIPTNELYRTELN